MYESMISSGFEPESYAIAVQKGNQKLLKEINRGLKEVAENGKFEKVSKDWFGHNILDTLKEE